MKMRALALLLLPCALATAQRGGSPSAPPRGGGGPVGGSGNGGVVPDRSVGGMASSDVRYGGTSSFSPGGHTPSGAKRMPPRPGGAPAVTKLNIYAPKDGSPRQKVVIPPEFPRCTVMPDAAYWGHRDIMAEIQWISRAGFLPVTPVDAKTETIVDHTWMPAGWKAYGFALPPGGRLQVEVQHSKLGWFRLMAVDKWGKPGPGMLQASIAHQPIMVTISNPSKKPDAAYIIVDDPAWWSTKDDPYTLVVRRDWDPATVDLSSVTLVTGLWGSSPNNSAEFRGPSRTGPAVFPH